VSEATLPSLEAIVARELPMLFRRRFKKVGNDIILGYVGDRGDGKSLAAAATATLDHMVLGRPCWSNMQISVEFHVDESLAAPEGLEPGTVRYESKPLNMRKFLNFAPEYAGGVFLIDEINIALADARRAMSNQNLLATDMGQQLRKLDSALVFTCISETFVELRIRDMTDIYVRTQDIALTPRWIDTAMPVGLEFEWLVYPISRKLTGSRYEDTGRTEGPYTFHGRRWWHSIDTMERQERGRHLEGSVIMKKDRRSTEWSWVYENRLVQDLAGGHREEVERYELLDSLMAGMPAEIAERYEHTEDEVLDYLEDVLKGDLRARTRWSNGNKFFLIPTADKKESIVT
jgi:hypothetical protein